MKILGIIPARFASTRFPGKPLVDIKGKSMIHRVYEGASSLIEEVIVATDDIRIANEVNSFSGKYVMTSELHKSGTDRCAEALFEYEKKTGKTFDAVINIQGDEPFINKEHLFKVIEILKKSESQISSLVKKINKNADIFNPNKPKVIFDKHMNAIYFSRSPIPFIRDAEQAEWHNRHNFYKHIGLYGYKSEILKQITLLNQSSLEKAESLEQNRWLENGYKITLDITEFESVSIDTSEDLEFVLKNLS